MGTIEFFMHDTMIFQANQRVNAQTHWFVLTQLEGLQWVESLATLWFTYERKRESCP